MRRIIRQIIRGCGTLPYVGDHPGTDVLIMFTIIGGLAGVERGGFIGFLGGSAFMLVCFGPFYLYGAYDRAEDSDRDVRAEQTKE